MWRECPTQWPCRGFQILWISDYISGLTQGHLTVTALLTQVRDRRRTRSTCKRRSFDGQLSKCALGESAGCRRGRTSNGDALSRKAAWRGQPLQLHGFVVSKSIVRKRDALEYRFDVQSNGHVGRAMCTGIVPDTFKDEAEVVLKGTLGPEGFHVRPDGIMAKCPSKYAPRPGSPEAAGTDQRK